MTFSKEERFQTKPTHYDCQESFDKKESSATIQIGKFSGKSLATQIAGHKNGMYMNSILCKN